jgi:PAS domain S-box-containing protein
MSSLLGSAPPARQRGRAGALPRTVKVDPALVLRLALLFSLTAGALLAWLVGAADRVLLLSVPALLVLALSIALAYALARQQALSTALSNAVDSLPIQFAYIDADQRCRFNNRAWQETWGLSAKTLYGKPLRELFAPAVYAQIAPCLALALAGQRQDFELQVEGGPGPRDLAVTLLPDRTAEGQVRGVYVLLTDIGPRKAAEQRERDQLLAMAQVARLASVGEITSEIAHQINQPLAAIAMFSNAAQRSLDNGEDPARLRDWMATINTQAKRASDVVQRLRRFAHQGEIRSAPIDLNASVQEALALADSERQAGQVAIALQLEPDLPPVLAADILVEQVLYNLLHNAIQAAARSEHGQIAVRTWADPQRVWLEVTDHTPEAPPRQDPAEAEDHCLGLALSRNILASLQGDMICSQQPQGGRRVCLSLPRLKP